MSIANDKIVNLQDAKVLYDDLRGRIKDNSVVEILDTPADIQSFSDAARFPMELKVGIDPVQDLHGYDHPWTGGAGKNIIPKGTTSTVSGVTFTVNDDGTVLVTGTSTSSSAVFWGAAITAPAGNYILNGCPSGGGTDSYRLDVRDTVGGSLLSPNSDVGNGISINLSESITGYVCIRVGANYAFPSAGLLFKPMIRLSTETDATYAPYENVCPISGWDGVKVTRTGANLIGGNALIAEMQKNEFPFTSIDGGFMFTANQVSEKILVGSEYFKENTQYTFFINFMRNNTSGLGNLRIKYTDGTVYRLPNPGTTATKNRYVTTSGKTVLQIEGDWSSGTTTVYFDGTGLFEGDVSAEDFEEYKGETYPISFPSASGTVYGGELTVHSDGSGEVVIDHAETTINGSSSISYLAGRFCMEVPGVVPSGNFTVNEIRCDRLETVYHRSVLDNNAAVGISGAPAVSTGGWVYFGNGNTAIDGNVQSMKTWLTSNPLQVVYKLSEPVAYSLTPGQVFALLGQDNIWANCGQINYLEYVRDTVGEVIPNRFDGIEQDIVDTNTYEKTISEANAIQSFDDGAEWPMGMQIAVNPIQDLHGYNNPWPGGSSKNLLPMNATLPVSSNGIRYNLKYDGTIDARGTATADAYVYVDFTSETLGTSGDLYFIGAPNGGASTYHAYVWDKTNNQRAKQWDGTTNCENAYGNGFKKVKILENVQYTFVCRVMNGVSVTNVVFTPMICLGTETDATFIPHENICPITGWNFVNTRVDGKNLFDPAVTGDAYPYPYTIRGITVSNDNGVITLDGTVESPEFFYPQNYGLYKNVILPSTTYVFTTGHVDSQMEIRVYYTERLNSDTVSNWKMIKSSVGKGELEFTTPSEFNSIWIRINYIAGVVLNNVKLYPMIRLATDVDPTFEPYAGKAYTVSFPSNAGTVYGGTLSVNKDGTGELSVNWKKKTIDGSYNWTTSSSGNSKYFYNDSLEEYMAIVDNTAFSDTYSRSAITSGNSVVGINLWNRSSSSTVRLSVRPVNVSSYTTETFKTYLEDHPFDICYELSSPTVYSLTHGQVLSLIGKNNVWADCGDILSLTYNSKQGIEFIREDTAGQIASVVNPVKTELSDAEAAMAIVVDGDTAPKNITSGQYVFVKNHSTLATGMYHATAAISSGASITSNNVEADADGGFNALTTVQTITGITKGTKVNSANYINTELCGKLCCIKGYFSINDSLATGDVLFNIPSNIQAVSGRNYFVVHVTNTDRFILLTIGTQIKVESLLGNTFASGDVFVFSYYYFIG